MQISDLTIIATAVTAFVALYGAALSTRALIIERQSKKARVRVLAYGGELHTMSDFRSTGSENVICVKAINDGQIPVYLSSVTYRLKGDKKRYCTVLNLEGDKLPYHLPPGKSCTCTVAARIVADGMEMETAKIQFCFTDETGRYHWAKPMVFDPAKFQARTTGAVVA